MGHYHLGINLGHDRSAAIVKSGRILVAIHQERLDRHKHSLGVLHQSVDAPDQTQLPFQAINYCLDSLGITLEDVSTITANMPGVDLSLHVLHSQLPASLHKKCLALPSHHLGHAYTAFYPSGIDEALVLSVDATGSNDSSHNTESYSVYRGKGNELVLLHSEKCLGPWAEYGTLGFIYEQVTRLANFVSTVGKNVKVPEAGKLMGLAPYGRHQPNWTDWCKPVKNSYKVEVSPYDIALEIEAIKLTYQTSGDPNHFSPWVVDLAYKAQQEIEKSLLHIVSHGLRETGLKKVCLAGGVALNSVANDRLVRELALDDLFVFPAAGDAGIAAGCALYGYHHFCQLSSLKVQRVPLKTANLGKRYPEDEIEQALQQYSDQIDFEKLPDDELLNRTGEAIVTGLIVARFEGGSEFGPRALGNRSIIADPSFEGIQDIINARVKGRERFRPFAPVVPLDEDKKVFEQHLPSPFMLLISKIKTEYLTAIPSVTHVDGTGRFQTVSELDNPFFYKLCKFVKAKRPGPAVILNTSYNLAGEPIVETPMDALKSFCVTDMDFLAIENYWVKKKVSAGNYQEKLAKIQSEEVPAGLDPDQPSVHATMQFLDRLLYRGVGRTQSMSDGYLEGLSSRIGHLKPTSSLFPSSGLPAAVLAHHIYPWLNPIGDSWLIDLRSNQRSPSFCFKDMEIIIAAETGNLMQLKNLRRSLSLTTEEWREKLHHLQLACSHFISFDPRVMANHTKPAPSIKKAGVFGAYSREGFSDREALIQFCKILKDTGYCAKNICAKLKIDSLQDIEPTKIYYYDRFLLGNSPLDRLIRLFLLQSPVKTKDLFESIPEHLCKRLVAHELIRKQGKQFLSNVDIYTVNNLWVATDHRYQLGQVERKEQPVMYIGLDSLGLINTAPQKPCGEALDLCSGSGVQALEASRYCDRVTAIDLNPRAIRFGRFNADLNGIDNVAFIEGDLYKSFDRKQKFDLIIANPPFVPSPEKLFRFRDGGATGEDILARIIEGAERRLSPTGRLHIVTDLVDILIYEDKLDRWWGNAPSEKLVLHTADRDEILFSVPHCHKPFNQSYADYNKALEQWVHNFRDSGINKVNFGYIIIHKSSRNSFYSRAIHSPKTPIHQLVSAYFNARKKLSDSVVQLNQYTLKLEPAIKFRHQANLEGDSESLELFIPDNPYFTTYKVDKEIFEALRAIGTQKTLYSEFITASNEDWVIDLILKGILQLEASGLGPARNITTDICNPSSKIVEQETKTTPTCVASYLS